MTGDGDNRKAGFPPQARCHSVTGESWVALLASVQQKTLQRPGKSGPDQTYWQRGLSCSLDIP
jgi:hypothetical protein